MELNKKEQQTFALNLSFIQSVNQSINQLTHRSINQSINRTVTCSTDQSWNWPIHWLIDRSNRYIWQIDQIYLFLNNSIIQHSSSFHTKNSSESMVQSQSDLMRWSCQLSFAFLEILRFWASLWTNYLTTMTADDFLSQTHYFTTFGGVGKL